MPINNRRKADTRYLYRLLALTPCEHRTIDAARMVLGARLFGNVRVGHAKRLGVEILIGRWLIIYEPTVPIWLQGMTLGEAFILGPAAFASDTELLKTVLQEIYRLTQRQTASGATSSLVAAQTNAARAFAEQEWRLLRWLLRN